MREEGCRRRVWRIYQETLAKRHDALPEPWLEPYLGKKSLPKLLRCRYCAKHCSVFDFDYDANGVSKSGKRISEILIGDILGCKDYEMINYLKTDPMTAPLTEIQDALWERQQDVYPLYHYGSATCACQADPVLMESLDWEVIIAMGKLYKNKFKLRHPAGQPPVDPKPSNEGMKIAIGMLYVHLTRIMSAQGWSFDGYPDRFTHKFSAYADATVTIAAHVIDSRSMPFPDRWNGVNTLAGFAGLDPEECFRKAAKKWLQGTKI